MEEDNYQEGYLGPVFSVAQPLTLPTVVNILRQKHEADVRSSERDGDTFANDSVASKLMQATREYLEVMQDACADEAAVMKAMRVKLHLRQDGGAGMTNAHLANLITDDEGNVIGMDNSAPAEDAAGGAAPLSERMKPFEVIAMSTLRPKTVEETVALIPSLARFDEADIEDVLTRLDS